MGSSLCFDSWRLSQHPTTPCTHVDKVHTHSATHYTCKKSTKLWDMNRQLQDIAALLGVAHSQVVPVLLPSSSQPGVWSQKVTHALTLLPPPLPRKGLTPPYTCAPTSLHYHGWHHWRHKWQAARLGGCLCLLPPVWANTVAATPGVASSSHALAHRGCWRCLRRPGPSWRQGCHLAPRQHDGA